MLKNDIKILKYIDKHPNIDTDMLQAQFSKSSIDLFLLRHGKFLNEVRSEKPILDEYGNDAGESEQYVTPRYICNDLGKEYLQEERRDSLRWAVPVIISVIALIKSFLTQITLLMEQILKLIAK